MTKFLEPSKLIPALMRYESHYTSETSTTTTTVTTTTTYSKTLPKTKSAKPESKVNSYETNYAIQYLESVVKGKKPNKDPAVHNYLISLYAKLPDEKPLLEFIESQQTPVYDYKYALRFHSYNVIHNALMQE